MKSLKKLEGIKPSGNGTVVEVHADLQRTDPDFIAWLSAMGFQDDPFTVFHPQGYVQHMTGRLRYPASQLRAVLPDVHALIDRVIEQGRELNFPLYLELELVRGIARFEPSVTAHRSKGEILPHFHFSRTGTFGAAKADIHVEFRHGTVTTEVHQSLLDKEFYWVGTPSTEHFPAEDIATLQTARYDSARAVYQALILDPPVGCTAIHLEQKLSMRATSSDLAMPEVIAVEQV
jgi:hypothetical protein